ncbi:MAG: PH domain-containing protein [Candidatus Saccharibacteria bacterium]
MVSSKSVQDQLRKIKFNSGWNKPEAAELAEVLLPDEEIFECVNGWYEGGYALLCATNVRVLLIDKKPFKFLNVEDLRFDMITQIDYSHRMFNASIGVSAGSKNLIFRSYNQPRLRKLISHVQHRMAELKKDHKAEEANQQNDAQKMNEQLRAYLLGQYDMRKESQAVAAPMAISTQMSANVQAAKTPVVNGAIPASNFADTNPLSDAVGITSSQLYEDGIKEIFGKYQSDTGQPAVDTTQPLVPTQLSSVDFNGTHVNPLKIAYSKLPPNTKY